MKIHPSAAAGFMAAVMLCALTPAHADGTRSAIEAANAEFMAATTKSDGAAVAALYAPKGQVLPPNGEPVEGADAIQKFWQGAMNSGVAAVGLKTSEVYGHGNIATEVGRYELKDKAGKVIDHGKYIVVWRQVDGKWRLFRDMFSSNVAAAKP